MKWLQYDKSQSCYNQGGVMITLPLIVFIKGNVRVKNHKRDTPKNMMALIIVMSCGNNSWRLIVRRKTK